MLEYAWAATVKSGYLCCCFFQMWTTRAAEKLKVQKLNLVRVLIPIVICKKVIKILISDVCAGWTVKPDKTPTVSLPQGIEMGRLEQSTCHTVFIVCLCSLSAMYSPVPLHIRMSCCLLGA